MSQKGLVSPKASLLVDGGLHLVSSWGLPSVPSVCVSNLISS